LEALVRGRIRHPHEFSAPWRIEVDRDQPVPSLADTFGNDRPIEIEIGHGHGTFLLAVAEARPLCNFLGVEWAKGRHFYAAERVAKRALPNVRLLRRDAAELLEKQIPAGTISAIHLYYPDPYWKRKQFGRRLVTASFVATVADVLAVGGRLLLKSDVPDRFDAMLELFAAEPRFRPRPWGEIAGGEPDAVSNFELKAVEAGHPLNRAAFERMV